ncbi:RICIN domain-containing protein [Streptomyces sp. NPDC006430]|uniref:RICIN domain-containing protein n=1 Tax=Streptomyces sp. NPDC006430 TaxID=3154299 RepID=UPI0033A52425
MRKKTTLRVLVAAGTLIGAVFAGVVPATAQGDVHKPAPTAASPAATTGALSPTGVFPTGDYFFKNVETSRCVDDSQAYGLRAFTCNWSNYQKFQFWQKGNGYYRIANYATGRCIDDSDAYGLRGFGCNTGPYQEWNLYSDGVTTHLRNRATGRNLDDSYEFGLRTFAPNDLSWQSFTFYRG